MMMDSRISAISAMLALCAITSTACSGDAEAPEVQVAGATVPPAEGIHGRLLHRLSHSDAHHVEFWEFEHRVLGVREVRPREAASLVTPGALGKANDIASLYQLLVPSSELPTRIHDAVLGRLPAYVDPTPQGASRVAGTREALLNFASTCNVDELDDNFGAHWFVSQFDLSGFRNRNWSRLNHESVLSPRVLANWFQWSVMAAEFVAGATASVEWQFPGNEKQLLVSDYPIISRTLDTWVFEGHGYYQGWARGDASCPRLHALAAWQ
jgi:hypothetical protein